MRSIVCLVGAGRIGKLYQDVLSAERYELILVDRLFSEFRRDGVFGSIEALPAEVVEKIQYWVVCVPTSSHLQVFQQILARAPEAKVLIEKPMFLLEQIPAALALVRKYPKCRVIENCQYEQSGIIDKLIGLIPDIEARRHQLRGIYIELTKNRLEDNQRGRFRDMNSPLLGYEGPHLIGMANKILSILFGRDIFEYSSHCLVAKALDSTAPDEGSGLFELRSVQLPPLRLYTSMIGEIGDDLLMARDDAGRKWIPHGDPDRYRVLRLDFDDDAYVIRFEPYVDESNRVQRNVQLMHRVSGGVVEPVSELPFNIFSDAIVSNLNILDDADFNSMKSLEVSYGKLVLLGELTRQYMSKILTDLFRSAAGHRELALLGACVETAA